MQIRSSNIQHNLPLDVRAELYSVNDVENLVRIWNSLSVRFDETTPYPNQFNLFVVR